MNTLMIKALSPALEKRVREALLKKGDIAAIRILVNEAGLRLTEARVIVDRVGRSIAPGKAHKPTGDTDRSRQSPAGSGISGFFINLLRRSDNENKNTNQ